MDGNALLLVIGLFLFAFATALADALGRGSRRLLVAGLCACLLALAVMMLAGTP